MIHLKHSNNEKITRYYLHYVSYFNAIMLFIKLAFANVSFNEVYDRTGFTAILYAVIFMLFDCYVIKQNFKFLIHYQHEQLTKIPISSNTVIFASNLFLRF